MSSKRILSGIQPTSDSFHLGNYLGALKQWVELQEGNDAFYCIVDLHALTGEIDPALLRKRILTSAAQLIALGISPEKSTLFVQSHVAEHNQLGWIPVGEDQRQHIELTRDLATRFNSRFGETFRIPEGYILKSGAKIYDLQEPTNKMSKSSGSTAGVLEIMDTPEANAKKIKSATTDAGREVKFDEKEKPGISNLLTIHSALSGKKISELENEFAGKGYGDFKGAVAEVVVEYLRPIRDRALELLEDESHLVEILHSGADKARTVASATVAQSYKNLGLVL